MPMNVTAAEPFRIALVIHGGAGISRDDLTPEREASCQKTMEAALRAGGKVLLEGGSSLDAVEAAIVILEDSPVFNAGRGSALTSDTTVEMDAALMKGENLAAGAVAAVTGVRNPIRLARIVMERTSAVMLVGKGAEELARQYGLPFEPPEWFITPEQQEKLKRAKAKAERTGTGNENLDIRPGTVGAVARDKLGHLAAGTSTGGMVNKRPGRIGDSPIIGAGTYAEDGLCAISCTGIGEFFLRAVVAHDLAALMKYRGMSLNAAATEIVERTLKTGTGGLIAIDSNGNIATPFNTPGMFRGWLKADGSLHIAIFKE